MRNTQVCVSVYSVIENDPGIEHNGTLFTEYIGYNRPSIYFDNEGAAEGVTVDLPEYDIRRALTGRDPLCALHAFWVNIRVVLPALYGYRMCPECPKCIESEKPCTDEFGSNATPMGGGGGRCDAACGAVEAQKAEGVLHMHAFMFFQSAHQFHTLHEIGQMLRQNLITIDMLKAYTTNVRRASYPDAAKFNKSRSTIESQWPAHKGEIKLSKPPSSIENITGTAQQVRI